MRSTTLASQKLGMGLAIALVMLSPLAVSAQSDLNTSEAQAFLGSWVVAMDTDFGAFNMNVEIVDQDGKVAASVGAPDMGGPMEDVSDVSKNGDDLVLNWMMDAQGQLVDASMTMSPDGSTMLSIADGQFMAPGEASRAN